MLSLLIRLTLVCWLFLLGACSYAASTAEVMARPASDVIGAEVTLGDIAVVQCSDKEMAEKLQAVKISASPLAGRSQNLTRDQILAALRRSGLATSANLLCPPQLTVTRPSSVITGQALLETARQFALTQTGSWNGKAEVEAARLPSDQVVPAGVIETRVRERALSIRRGRNTLPVEVVVDGRIYSTTHVSVNIRVFGTVLIAAQSISKSTELTTVNTLVQEREITTLPTDALSDLPAAIMTAAVPIAEGAVIRRNWISEPAVIRSGDIVVVAAVGGSVRVTDRGVAASDGRPGERIKIRMMGDSREVRGIVAGPGLVEINIDRRS